MDSSGNMGAPAKPPRGNKTGKETGILMTVIKTLSTSVSTDHRDREKSKLEKEFKRSEQKLDGLISENQESLTQVMQTFGKVSGEIGDAKVRLKEVKSHLMNCKKLLHCRRDELERLWLDWVEHKHALELLEKVEKLRTASENFNKLVGRRQYLVASQSLMSCFECWDADLEHIEGLKDVYSDLKSKKEKLHELLVTELNTELYTKWYTTAVEMKKQGIGGFNPFERSSSERRSSGKQKMITMKAKRFYLGVGNEGGQDFKKSFAVDTDITDEESDATLSEIVQCMICLKKLPKLIETIKQEFDEKFLGIVNHSSQQIIEYGDANGISDTDTTLLTDLLTTLFTQFRYIVKSHVRFLMFTRTALKDNEMMMNIYTEEYVWEKAQSVLMSTLKIYFDLSDSKSNHAARVGVGGNFLNSGNNNADLSSFFQRKRAPRQKRTPLFKFEYSLHGLNIQDYVSDGNTFDRSLVDKHRFLVCKPNPRNILVIQECLLGFMNEIEFALGGHKCELRKFMRNKVNSVFVKQLYKEISELIDLCKKNVDSWQETISVEEAKHLSSPRPLLQNVVQIGRSVQEVIALSKDLPSHCDELIKVLDALLVQYKDVCNEAYRNMVHQNNEGKGLLSAVWVRDADIERFLKSLPNWSKLQRRKEKKMESFDESPDDLRAQNVRESELLCGEFGAKIIQKHEILSDISQTVTLANLHESLEWFSGIIRSVNEAFDMACGSDAELRPAMKKLNALAQHFQDIANQCLLVLHLEVRVHCFYYIRPLTTTGEFSPNIDSQKADDQVVLLSRDLNAINHALSSHLQPVKCKYIFEGVGTLVCAIIVNGAQEINRINENGVKKICRDIFLIQQTLSNITGQAEHSLDHARAYYELFTLSPEALVNTILEKGPQFKELEYVTALKLLFRSRPGLKQEDLSDCLSRLSSILGDIGVTV